MHKHIIIFLLAIIAPQCIQAQYNLQINTPTTMVGCNNNCLPITLTHPNFKSTSAYSVSSTPYQTIATPLANSLTLADDAYSSLVPIGFDFCFYGNTFNSCVIGSNGLIGFNSTFANISCYNNTSITLPFANGTFPNKAIALPFIDVDPSAGGSISYQTTGVAPNRKFTVAFNNVLLFSGASSVNNSFYAVLFETTNQIEIHVGNKGVINAANPTSLDSSTLGVQDFSTSSYTCPPNRNGGVWTTSNEAWKFVPSGPNNFTVQWNLNGSNISAQALADTVCFTNTGANILWVKYTNICPPFILTDTITVNKVNPKIDSLTVTQPNCKYDKGTIVVHASSNFMPLLYNHDGGPFGSNNVFSNLPVGLSGLDSFLVQDASGCFAFEKKLLTSISNLNAVISAGTQSKCDSSDITACAIFGNGVIPYTYWWSNGDSTICSDSIKIYTSRTFYIKDALNCIDSSTASPILKFIGAKIDSFSWANCPIADGKIFVSGMGGTAPYSFLWSYNGITTSSITNLPGNATYTCTVTDADGCSTQIGTNIKNNKTLKFSVATKKASCGFPNGSFTLTPTVGTAPFSYSWVGGGNTPVKNNITALSASVVFVVDSNGCVGDTLLVMQDTLSTILTKSKTDTKCGYNNGSATITATMGAPPYTYVWTPAGPNAAFNPNLGPGMHYVTVTDSLQCVRKDSIFVDSSKKIQFVFNNKDPFCDSTNGRLIITPSNGTPLYTYAWTGGPTDSTWSGLAPGTYSVVVTDAANCTVSATAILSDLGTPRLSVINYVPPRCYGDSNGSLQLVGVNGSSPYKYSTDGINFATTAILTNISGGSYDFYIRDANSCTIDTTIVLFKPEEIKLNFNAIDTVICYGDKIPVVSFQAEGGSAPLQFQIDNGIFSTDTFALQLGGGAHQVTVKDSANCIKNFNFNIPSPAAPITIDIKKENVSCFVDSTGKIVSTVDGGWGNYILSWSNGEQTLSIDQLIKGIYSLQVVDAEGCSSSTSITLSRDTCCLALVPSAFTPNRDNDNETLGILVYSDISEVDLNIYNRFGNIVFTTKDISSKWDGKFQNEFCDVGTYFYLLRYKCSFSKEVILVKGEVTLIR